MKNKNAVITACTLALFVFLLASCTAQKNTEPMSDQSEFEWSIRLLSRETVSRLKGKSEEVMYSGEINATNISQEASANNTFIILELEIKKNKDTMKIFSWSDVYILTEDGMKYSRMKNDSFLELFGRNRIKAVDMTFGAHQGYVCFEVPVSVSRQKLFFVHEADGRSNLIRIIK